MRVAGTGGRAIVAASSLPLTATTSPPSHLPALGPRPPRSHGHRYRHPHPILHPSSNKLSRRAFNHSRTSPSSCPLPTATRSHYSLAICTSSTHLSSPPGPPKQRPYFASTDDLLSRFHLLPAYDRYVRPFASQNPPQIPSLPTIDKGKGKEKDIPQRDISAPAASTPLPHNDQDEDDQPPKGERKWKNNYKHMIKGIPGSSLAFFNPPFLPFHLDLPGSFAGKHSMKKDDFLVTIMQVPPKQRNNITPFDLRTQRDAFSVSLEGLKGWNINALVAETPQAREDRKKRKELKKLAKAQALAQLAAGASSPSAHSATPNPTTLATPSSSAHPPLRTATPKPTALPPNRAQQPQNSSQIRSRTPAAVGTPRSASTPTVSQHPPPSTVSTSASAPSQLHQVSTPAPTPNAGPDMPPPKKSLKRDREDATSGPHSIMNGTASSPTVVNGNLKPHAAKPGANGIRLRPVKKQRMDSQGQAREMPIQQPTPHA
ncbi:hypothetical protein NLI96_g11374 [Meripilus lineatus]|uniref:Uncharacterized protein n=1 Tax=Meripilus lineatus TaxID=2056292 RepID=A0AAD5UTF9_9APHY|nr:hypothetical protein NLI96_g11374 [Physisporinus lineatus]